MLLEEKDYKKLAEINSCRKVRGKPTSAQIAAELEILKKMSIQSIIEMFNVIPNYMNEPPDEGFMMVFQSTICINNVEYVGYITKDSYLNVLDHGGNSMISSNLGKVLRL
jgi:hypothetical protein